MLKVAFKTKKKMFTSKKCARIYMVFQNYFGISNKCAV